jgi:hypothetical protein
LRSVPSGSHIDEPGWREWKTPTAGRCGVCGKWGLLLRHHVILEQHVRVHGGDPWDLRNALGLGYYACSCHRDHHHAVRRIPASKLTPASIEFAIELLGAAAADQYFDRYYAAR